MTDTGPRPWVVTWRGHRWTGADLTGADLVDLELFVQGGWRSLDPWAHPTHLVALIAVLTANHTDTDAETAILDVKRAPAEEIIGALTPE